MQNQIKKIRFLTLMAMAFFMGVAFAIDVSASPSSGENNEAPPQSRLHRPGQGGGLKSQVRIPAHLLLRRCQLPILVIVKISSKRL
jgi:hypothetical protein